MRAVCVRFPGLSNPNPLHGMTIPRLSKKSLRDTKGFSFPSFLLRENKRKRKHGFVLK